MPKDTSITKVLEQTDNEGYGEWPLPCKRDFEINDVVTQMIRGPEIPDRRETTVLLAFAERMASLSRRNGNLGLLRSGLDAAALSLISGDSREGLSVLTLLWKTAEALELDPSEEFSLTATRLPGARPALIEFLTRDPNDRTLDAMGYVESKDNLGFRYKRTW